MKHESTPLYNLKRKAVIDNNIEAIQEEIKLYQTIAEKVEGKAHRQGWADLIGTLQDEINRQRSEKAAIENYLAAIQKDSPDIYRMIDLFLHGVSWARIHAIMYGYSNGGAGANYCYVKVKRYLIKHPMERTGKNDDLQRTKENQSG